MLKVQFGAGWRCKPQHSDPGWINHDIEVDITKPLAMYADGTVDFIFTEHCVEHVTHRDAWNFFGECHRILRPGGVLRVAVPSVTRIFRHRTPEYDAWLKTKRWSDGTPAGSVRSIIFNHQHQSCWTGEMLLAFLKAQGFKLVQEWRVNESSHQELASMERHGEIIGDVFNEIETICVEATR